MKLVNNLYYEVLYAHFKYVVHYKPEDTLTFQENCFISDGYRFPIHFFDWFDVINAKEESEALLLLKRHYEEMKSKFRELPKLEDVDEPTAIYYEFWGIKLALKEIIVPHPDGNTSSICYKYHFYRIGSLLKFVFTTNSVKRAILFNDKLKTRTTKIVEGLFPVIVNQKGAAQEFAIEFEINDRLPQTVNAVKSGDFTTRMKCIIVMQMMSAMGIDFSKVNLTQYARFLHQLFSKPIPKDEKGREIIANSPLYKTVKTLYRVSPNRLKGDLIHIKSELEQFDFGVSPTPYKTMLNQLENKILEARRK